MARRRVPLAALLTALLTASVAPVGAYGSSERTHVARGTGGGSFQPDGWIKLCGLSTGCTIDPLPHPWRGKDVYNTTGRKQTVPVDINEGEGVRFWITVQNDGTKDATFAVQGCPGTRYFEVNSVVLGKHRRPDAGATNVTREYMNGTLAFDLERNQKAVFTLNIVTHFRKNITYQCVTTIRSQSDPDSVDAVVAKMTTY